MSPIRSNVAPPNQRKGHGIPPKDWTCPECGRENRSYMASCPDCYTKRPNRV